MRSRRTNDTSAPHPRLRAVGIVAIAAAGATLDLLTKSLVRARIDLGSERVELLPFFELRHTRNTGIAFGLFSGAGIWVVLGTFVVGLLLFVFLSRIPATDRATATGVALVAGGAIGNLSERLDRGYVTDFLHLPHWPTFNVADTCITIGVLLVLVAQWRAPAAAHEVGENDAPRG